MEKKKSAVKSFSKKLSIMGKKETLKIKLLKKKDFRHVNCGQEYLIAVYCRVYESSYVKSCSFLNLE